MGALPAGGTGGRPSPASTAAAVRCNEEKWANEGGGGEVSPVFSLFLCCQQPDTPPTTSHPGSSIPKISIISISSMKEHREKTAEKRRATGARPS